VGCGYMSKNILNRAGIYGVWFFSLLLLEQVIFPIQPHFQEPPANGELFLNNANYFMKCRSITHFQKFACGWSASRWPIGLPATDQSSTQQPI
jgi:hypothetical protein